MEQLKVPTQEERREARQAEVLASMQKFVADEKFVDHFGIPLEIKKVVWPVSEDFAAAEKLKGALAENPDHTWDFVLEKCIQYLESPAIFDTLRSHQDHHLRRKLEKDFKDQAEKEKQKDPDSKEAGIFEEAQKYLKDNRLSRNYYTMLLSAVRDFEVEHSEETKKYFDKENVLFPLSEATVSEQVDFEYDKLTSEEKEEMSREHAKFAISLAQDFLHAH